MLISCEVFYHGKAYLGYKITPNLPFKVGSVGARGLSPLNARIVVAIAETSAGGRGERRQLDKQMRRDGSAVPTRCSVGFHLTQKVPIG